MSKNQGRKGKKWLNASSEAKKGGKNREFDDFGDFSGFFGDFRNFRRFSDFSEIFGKVPGKKSPISQVRRKVGRKRVGKLRLRGQKRPKVKKIASYSQRYRQKKDVNLWEIWQKV